MWKLFINFMSQEKCMFLKLYYYFRLLGFFSLIFRVPPVILDVDLGILSDYWSRFILHV